MALGWTEESIAAALVLSVRQIRRLRLLANVFPAMLEDMARGDLPSEQQLRTIAAASHNEQAEVWKKYKPKKQEKASWWEVARALTNTRMLAKDASFGDDLRQAYGIVWQEGLFAPARIAATPRTSTRSSAFPERRFYAMGLIFRPLMRQRISRSITGKGLVMHNDR
ncbi:hypothetical protein EV132_1088 [Rhizobium sullae]|uniref:Uncharacterized protein n=1 Tax=Rhizobium sullae TaxID=50338 RepID=A0A4R3Q5W6_RHISU|nr:hypothetical protein EV132_1088 [Rhizobium sullae]